jgi:hypothetical protein
VDSRSRDTHRCILGKLAINAILGSEINQLFVKQKISKGQKPVVTIIDTPFIKIDQMIHFIIINGHRIIMRRVGIIFSFFFYYFHLYAFLVLIDVMRFSKF